MLKVATYLEGLHKNVIRGIFFKQLRNLEALLQLQHV